MHVMHPPAAAWPAHPQLCAPTTLLQIELAAEETQGAAVTSERGLLQLVEALAAAGSTCAGFLAEHSAQPPAGAAAGAAAPPAAPPALVYPSLLLAAGAPAWCPTTHHRWPAGFRAAARTALCALQERGIERCIGGPRLTSRGSSRLRLPPELCHAILRQAALTLSCWVGT